MYQQPATDRVVFVGPPAHWLDRLRQLLEFEGISVSCSAAEDAERGRSLCADVVILNQIDLRGSTFALAAALRTGVRPLTLALVGPGDELTGVELVERAVDAYVTSTCGSREFVARVRALLRRARRLAAVAEGPRVEAVTLAVPFAELHVDPSRRRARLRGHDLRLTEQEFQLLYLLAGHPGRVFDRRALLAAVWGPDTFVTARSVDALVKRLRQQLRAVRGDSFVETVRGVGYRLAERGVGSSLSAA